MSVDKSPVYGVKAVPVEKYLQMIITLMWLLHLK